MKKICALLLFSSVIVQAQIVPIPDANFKAKLIALGIDGDSDGEIQTTEASATTTLNVSNSSISDLSGIEAFTNLTSLNCQNNSLSTLNLDTLTSLTFLECNSNNLTSINLTALVNLHDLFCQFNQLTVLDLHNLQNLASVTAGFNQLTSLNVNGCISLDFISLENNNFTTLDFSGSTARQIACDSNHSLQYINMKNGILSQDVTPVLSLSDLPALQHVCVDELEDSLVTQVGVNPNVVAISTYCNFVPGGNYNTISGNISLDWNNNGCGIGDFPMSNLRMTIDDGTNQCHTFVNSSGNYTFYTQAGNFTLTPESEGASYFTFAPVSGTVDFPLANFSVTVQDFCVTPNGVHPDLEIVLAPIGRARPGFDANYRLIYKNKGNQVMSGSLNLTFDDNHTDLVTAIPAPDNQSLNSLLWNYSELQPFETRSIDLTLHLNSPVETPALNAGDILNFTTAINVAIGDETPNDNAASLKQILVNSLDPNDKTCLEGDTVTPENIGKYLHYNINFENTGTADAVNVVVKDVIDTTQFDIHSIQLLYASHPVETKINGDKVEFIFENIDLPPFSINPIGGHGNVLFKIKTLDNLPEGTEVSNMASIYFDYNLPIDTNVARTIFAPLATAHFVKDNSVTVYPNPAKNSLQISAKSNIKSIALFDIDGRILQSVSYENTNVTLDISTQQRGVYFLNINTEKGSKIEKIVKE